MARKIILFVFFFLVPLSLKLYLPSKTVPEPPQAIKEIPQIAVEETPYDLKKFNTDRKQINSIIYRQLSLTSQGITVEGRLSYQKDKSFRLTAGSIFGKEFDVGSNNEYFWFWSKRMKPAALYYAKHEHLYNTRLRTPFHPNWLMELIGVNEVPTVDVKIRKYNDKIVVFKENKSVMGQPVVMTYLIDPVKNTCQGLYLYTSNMKPIISAEFKQFHQVSGVLVPKQVEVYWYEEHVSSVWRFGQPQTNTQMDSTEWQIPSMKREIDLNGY